MLDLYVYYKVRAVNAARLAPLVRALQAQVIAAYSVSAQLKRRPEDKDGLQTWMEVYPLVADDFADQLARAAAEAGFDGLIEGPRRVELFMDLPPCA